MVGLVYDRCYLRSCVACGRVRAGPSLASGRGSLADVVDRANSQECEDVLEALHVELDDVLTDDWKRLADGLDLIFHLLDTTPQLM